MYNKDVKELYHYISYGTRVKIVKGPYGNFGEGLRVLKPGDTGADVYEVQKILKEKGYFNGYVSGKFGTDTQYAVHKFKKDHRLYGKDIVDNEVYKAMGIKLMD